MSAVGSRPPIIIYLPPGPIIPTKSIVNHDQDVAYNLATQSAATVVSINYRLGHEHQWPTPIHDVLFGYDWIVRNLVPQRAVIRPGRSPSHDVRIGVFGELIGGGLAAMLALTECHTVGPRIAAAVLNEPIVDWVFPEEAELEDAEEDVQVQAVQQMTRRKSPKRGPKASSFHANTGGLLSPAGLVHARRTLFRKPEDYFDSFASPALFFRSAGTPVPAGSFDEPLDEFAELAQIEQQDFYRQQMRLSALSGLSLSDHPPRPDVSPIASKPSMRKSSKRYPKTGSGLKLPPFLLSCAQKSPLLDQVEGFASLIVRSRMRDAEAERSEAQRLQAIEQTEGDVVCDVDVESSELWTTRGRKLSSAVDWFRQHL